MITYLKRYYQDLSEDDIKCLRKLTFKKYSGMKDLIDGNWGDLSKTWVVIARDTETYKYIGWVCGIDHGNGKLEVGVFVSSRYRRRGIGKKLIDRLIEYTDATHGQCFLHNDESNKFYRSVFTKVKKSSNDTRAYVGRSSFKV